jgi:agarase
MGVMIQNELAWGESSGFLRYNVAVGIMRGNASTTGKVWFRDYLRSKYSTITALNTAWGTSFASWDSFLTTTITLNVLSDIKPGMEADFQKLQLEHARKFFSHVKSILNKYNYKGLYMGCRFHKWTPEALQAAKEFTDVVTINYYGVDPEKDLIDIKNLDKPVIITEMSYSSASKPGALLGSFWNIAGMSSQDFFVDQIYSTYRNWNNIVGTHWFRYIDQPWTGDPVLREAHGFGLVTVTDIPKDDVVLKVRENNIKNLLQKTLGSSNNSSNEY